MENLKLWQAVLSELEVQVSKPVFQTFFAGTSLVSLENGVATLGCPNPLIQKMIETRYYSLLKSVLDKQTTANNSLVFTVTRPPQEKEKKEIGPLFERTETEVAQRLHLRPDFTFANFAVSAGNQMAYAAATAIIRSPGNAYNPLFLYGGVGVGKTHLMQATGHALLEKERNLKSIYCTGEEFTNEIIEAIQTKTTRRFKEKYRSAKALLIDDIQFIAGKTTVQEEFFHTFNTVQREGGQIVLTSDRPPQEIAKLEERLRSRFEGGLIVDIAPPDFELRCAILLIKAKQRGINLPMEVVQLLSANISSTRRLEGTLIRLATEAETKKVSIDTDLAKSVLGKTNGEPASKKRVSPAEVLEAVANRFNIKASALRGPKRDKILSFPRQVAMHILRVDCGLPLTEVGQVLGNRDHTTVMHGVEKISTLLSTKEGLREDIAWIKRQLWG